MQSFDEQEEFIGSQKTDLGSSNSSSSSSEKPQEIPMCGCLSVAYYRPYFDVVSLSLLLRP